MTGSAALDIVISMVFIYLLYSLLATIVQEILASNIMRLRSKVLEEGIKRMLDDDNNGLLSDAFYKSPLIRYLGQTNKKKPAYLAPDNFSKALLDILKGQDPQPGADFRVSIDDSLRNGIQVSEANRIVKGETLKFLRSLWADAQGDVEKFKFLLEHWFDDAMDRATGWYKRKTQGILFFVGLGIAIIFNVDTIEIVRKLSANPKLTAQVVQQADNFLKAHPNLGKALRQRQEQIAAQPNETEADSLRDANSAVKEFDALKAKQDSLLSMADSLVKSDIKNLNGLLGSGIQSYEFRGSGIGQQILYVLLSLFGWSLTALALSLGAPFWFDLLNKLMKLRNSVPIAADDKSADTSKTNKEKKAVIIKG